MPSHVPSDEADLASSDEVKVFDDEGEFSEERRSSSIGDGDVTEEMNELKQKLIDEEERPPTQQSQGPTAASSTTSRQATSQSQSQSTQQSNQPSVSSASGTRQSPSTQMGLEASASNSSHPSSSSLCAFGAYYSPFHPSNGSLAPGSKVPPLMMSPGPPALSFMVHNMDTFPQPPPAHMGSHIEKGKEKKFTHYYWPENDRTTSPLTVIPRPSLYPLGGPSQYPHVFPELTQWHSPAMYPIPSSGFRGSVSYPASLSGPPPAANFVRYGQSLIPPYPPIGSHTGLTHHPALMKHPTHPHDLMAAVAALNQPPPGHIESRTLHQSYSGGHNSLQSTPSPHLPSMPASSATLDQKPHAAPHTHSSSSSSTSSSSLISRMTNGRVASPSDSSIRSGPSPASSECKAKLASNGLTLNNNRIGHLNQNHNQNGTAPGSDVLASNNSSNNNNNSSSGNHNGSTGNNNSSNNNNSNNNNNNPNSQGHVKKPLNAFMLYMKEQRPNVVAEFTLKESAQINQILGKKWHALNQEEQQKYYEMARKERADHQLKYPNWSARDNYAINQKKKKKKRDKSADGEPGSLKKCRARYGLQQQASWCKPCRRKKKCIRYSENSDQPGAERDNLGSVGSAEAQTPDSKSANESDVDNLNLSSAELSLSSPPVPSSDHHLLHLPLSHHRALNHHQSLAHGNFLQRNSPSSASSSSSLAALSGPPRNSPIGPNNPLSIEQLTRPHIRPVT